MINRLAAFFIIQSTLLILVIMCMLIPPAISAEPIIVDHTCTDITQIPQSAIEQAKANLHIAYGHTSHGSQLTTGMTGLVSFANVGGLGLSLPTDIFEWNNGGRGGALDLHDYAMSGDVGYYPQWVDNTRAYLENAANSDVNVLIWSWCGQVGSKYASGTLDSEYLTPMADLEAEYPNVKFVYVTGHVDIWDDANNKAANQMIRDYCIANNKILYDFADIERYNPDGTYYEYVNDNCDYYDGAGGTRLGNWATEWQSSHTENVDWYSCSSAHSQPLNANRKAYAAWYLWTRIAGWNPMYTTYFFDSDGDGYGDPDTSYESDQPLSGYVTDNTDCDDNDSSIHPGATEIRGDGIDQDCNGGDLIELTDSTYIEIQAFVNRFYNEVMDRDGDTGGLEYWADSLYEGKLAGSDVAKCFILSEEFKSKNIDDGAFLDIMYRAFFNRLPDQGGYNFWLNELNNGASREIVLEGFLYSAEFYSLCDAYGIIPVRYHAP